MLFQLTRKEALEYDLLVCQHCGFPPNNHFDFEKRKCAHDNTCPGYQEVSKIGKLIEE